jgi:uncharacterized protein
MTSRRQILTALSGAGALPFRALAQNRSSASLVGRLTEAFDRIEAINTHEHIIPEAERVAQSIDFFTLAGHYAINDVVSAGLPPDVLKKINDQTLSTGERWRLFEPFWKPARLTGYGQALRIAIRDIYGLEISAGTLPKINDAIRAQNKPGLYRRILKDRARIRVSVLDDYWNAGPVKPDPEFFVLAHKFDRFVTPSSKADIERLQTATGVSITSLAGLKQSMEANFRQLLDIGMVTVKSTMAYNRELLFREIPAVAAESDLEALMGGTRQMPEAFRRNVERPFRNLEDHMFHHLMQLADAHNVPVQIHTGLHAGNGNFIANSNPVHLTNLFFLYPKVQFDLFHISYPYQGELSVLAKLFPNVHVDFCWAHIISPSVSRRTLHEMLETVPYNKIFGFGGDYRYPELSYAHAKMARRNITQVLAEKTEERFCSEDEALDIGRAMLHDNPERFFLKGRKG